MNYVIFDITDTETRVAVSRDFTSFGEVLTFVTPTPFNTGMSKLVNTIEKLTTNPTAIAGGIRGVLTEDKTGIQNDVILTSWIGKSVVGAIKKRFDVPVFLENDTAIAGVGEAIYGAGAGLEIIAYHTIDTGIGGVKIENGTIDLASVGFEPGHQVLDIDRTILGSDITPTLENLISGIAIKARYGVEPSEIPQSDVLWNELAEHLAQGLRNTILYWSPDAIVLGGSLITDNPHIDIDTIRKYTVEALDGFVPAPHITKAKLGDNASLYGALAILKQHL